MTPLLLFSAASATGFALHTVETPYGEMAYWDEGEGDETLILVHGLPTSKEVFREVVPLLSGQYRVIALDLHNFGDSEKVGALVHRERAAGVEALRDALQIESFVLVAHDLGASVAVDYMGLYGEHVSRLVLMSPPVYPDFQEPDEVELARRPVLGRALLHLTPRTLYRQAMRKGMVHDAQLTRQDVRDFAAFYRGPRGKRALWDNLWWGTPEVMFASYPAIFPEIAVPTLVLQGRQDPWIPLEHAERLDRDIPDSILLVIEDGGHFLPLDTPDAVARAIRGFLSV